MPSHPIDFEIQANVFSFPELAAVFDEKKRLGRWLQFEAALARVQGRRGIIPERAAEEISNKARLENLDLQAVAQGYQESRNSLIPILKALRQACSDNLGEFVHYGVTTQDVLDSAHVLEMKEAAAIIYRDLRILEQALAELAARHKSTPMVGRTHGQQALPITFGLKVAVWLAEIRRHIERLQEIAPRVMKGQIGGAVGTMAALGPQAAQVAAETLAELGLRHAPVAWHTARDSVAELASFLAIFSATLEKIANEIFQLGKTEIAELREPAPGKSMSSSTMPHKQNPVLCQRVAVLSRHVRALAPLVVDNMIHEHERDTRCLWSEWLAMPQICIYTGTALHYLVSVLKGLEVDTERMLANLHLHREMLASEWLLFRMAEKLGKMEAQKKLHTLIIQARDAQVSLKDMLIREGVDDLLSSADLEMLDRPEQYKGRAEEIVAETLQEIEKKQQNDPEVL